MSDVFETNGNGSVELLVNGQSKGGKRTNGQNVGTFVKNQAQAYGLKSFSVYINGQKFFTEQASQPLPDGAKVEIVAKDARGLMTTGGTEGPAPPPTPAPAKQPDGDPGDEQPAAA